MRIKTAACWIDNILEIDREKICNCVKIVVLRELIRAMIELNRYKMGQCVAEMPVRVFAFFQRKNFFFNPIAPSIECLYANSVTQTNKKIGLHPSIIDLDNKI